MPTKVDDYNAAVSACQLGHPKRFIESYLKINPAPEMEGAGALVPFKFMPTQDMMYGQTFGGLRGYDEGFQAVIGKAREVLATSLFMGASPFAFAYNVPGIRIMLMIDNEAKFKTAIQPMLKGFYDNLDENEMGVRKRRHVHWDTEIIEFEHSNGSTHANSFIAFASSKSVDAIRSFHPKFFVFSEAAFADRGNEPALYTAVDGVLGTRGWGVYESTAQGPDGNFYERYRAFKEGRLLGKAIFIPFHADPLKRLRPDSLQYQLHMRNPEMTEHERQMAQAFPRTVPVDEVIAWWRMKYEGFALNLGGDRNAALSTMMREFPLDDVSMWTAPVSGRFDPKAMLYHGTHAKEPFETRPMPGGWDLKMWEPPLPGHVYTMGADFATGKDRNGQGDATTFQVFDATIKTYVAELHSPQIGVYHSLIDAYAVVKLYNDAMFIPENDTVGTTAVAHLQARGYENVYYDLKTVKPGKPLDYGWDARSHVLDLWALFQGYFNGPHFTIPNGALSADCARYNPNRDDHWPDRMRAAALALHAAVEHGLLGREATTSQSLAARPRFYAGPSGVYFAARR